MKFSFFILCFSAPLYLASALSSDGLTLLSLLKHWTFLPPSINSSWKASDSTPCPWVGVQCDHNSFVISLNLTASGISGQLGPEIGNLNHLQSIVLFRNGFSGTIPPELGNCSLLEYVDLSENSLSGHIPYTLKNLHSLKHVLLHDNNLSGELPLELTELKNLKNISLFYNHLSGIIPQSLGINSSLVKLDLMNNNFTGSIPPNLCFGKQLRVLNVGLNQLHGGEVPLEIGQLKKLQCLDVSLNNLTGGINILNELSSLIDVNISYNSFVGPVPKRLMLFLNSSPSSFFGNPGLCVQCLPSNGLNCIKTTYLKSCDYGHKGLPRYVILILELGSSMLVSILLVKLIHMHFSGQISQDDVIDYYEEQKLWSIDSGDHRIIDLVFKREVMKATENLNDQYIIGEGGHGVVYRADLDCFGVFAVKKIVITRNKRRRLSMVREIELVKDLRHQNVARFLGSWVGKTYGLIFTRYVENGTLHDILHENDPLPYLAWNIRYKIAIGIAKGLAYLHDNCDPPILHRDIKPKNILLDYDMKPYITDFGISIALNQSSAMIRMRSTYHLEIAYTTVLSCKSDIYSYGVVLLELITRKKVLDSSFEEEQTTLVEWFRSAWTEAQKIEKIIDPSLASELSDLDKEEVIDVLWVAFICTEKDPGKRMEMRDIVKFFEALKYSGDSVQYDHKSIYLGNSLDLSATSLSFQVHMIEENDYVMLKITLLEHIGKSLPTPHYKSVSLHYVLHERHPPQTLKWNVRYKIAVEIAHELAHFHHECDPPVVHQDINSRNILLDSEMKPHISEPSTSSAREASTMEESVKFDVYNYGVVLLELITMKKVLNSSLEKKAALVEWAGSVWRRTGDTKKIVDSGLGKELCDSSVAEQVFKVLWVALLCSWKEPSKRPTMRTVVKLL
ncbi:receptor-like protein kinase [Senna tora]|uniref:non-specific serine/threonine protein kinase n=1 Tax=Senna tora TaxID=362788 RepID=A0A834XH49_9FABA|nr:receptor-like protein kinase [Senna tora]